MAENNQNQFQCTGDCLNCRMNAIERKTQWQYCAAQFSYNSLRTMQAMRESVNAMAGEINELKAKIEAIQNSEATVLAPNAEVVIEADKEEKSEIPNLPIAQEEDGV